jgi:hypothetical protein
MSAERSGGPLVPRDEVEAALAARRDLGSDYEREIADALAERIEQRLEARLRERVPARRNRNPELALAIVSLAVAIPLLGVAGGTAGLAGVIAVCIAIVLVNVVFARR